jgi:hypothetical protein
MADLIMTDDEGRKYSYENLKTQGWLEGHSSGLDAAANYLKDLAVELFKSGKDTEAMAMRKLAEKMVQDLEPDMRKRAIAHEHNFPADVTDQEVD